MASPIHFRYNPITVFDHSFDNGFNAREDLDSFRPRMDVKKSDDSNNVTATFELPGLKPEDVTIDLQQNRLTVSGESGADNTREGTGYTVRERRYGKFARTLQLPFGTKAEDVKAKMENGILSVTFPKSTPEQEPRRIAIQ